MVEIFLIFLAFGIAGYTIKDFFETHSAETNRKVMLALMTIFTIIVILTMHYLVYKPHIGDNSTGISYTEFESQFNK